MYTQLADDVQNSFQGVKVFIHVFAGEHHQVVDVRLAVISVWVSDTRLCESLELEWQFHPQQRQDSEFI